MIPTGTACERARGLFRAADVTAPGAAWPVLAVARASIAGQQWRITDDALEVIPAEGAATREAARVAHEAPARCTLELTHGTRQRTLYLDLGDDGRVRAYAVGTPTGVILERVR